MNELEITQRKIEWPRISFPAILLPRVKVDTIITVIIVTLAALITVPVGAVMVSDATDLLPYKSGETIQGFAARREARKAERGYY